jgi:hypothetical protein
MDQSLIKLVNKLQDAFNNVGIQNPVDLPQITVLGSQSSCVAAGRRCAAAMLTWPLLTPPGASRRCSRTSSGVTFCRAARAS